MRTLINVQHPLQSLCEYWCEITHQESVTGLSGAAENHGGHQTHSVRLQQLWDVTCWQEDPQHHWWWLPWAHLRLAREQHQSKLFFKMIHGCPACSMFHVASSIQSNHYMELAVSVWCLGYLHVFCCFSIRSAIESHPRPPFFVQAVCCWVFAVTISIRTIMHSVTHSHQSITHTCFPQVFNPQHCSHSRPDCLCSKDDFKALFFGLISWFRPQLFLTCFSCLCISKSSCFLPDSAFASSLPLFFFFFSAWSSELGSSNSVDYRLLVDRVFGLLPQGFTHLELFQGLMLVRIAFSFVVFFTHSVKYFPV